MGFLRLVIFKLTSMIDFWDLSRNIAFSQDLTDDKSTWDQAMAWCRQVTSRYLT